MTSILPFEHSPQYYRIVSPEGNQIQIPKELFGALLDFVHGSKPNGSVVIQFRNGGIAGLEGIIKKIYK